MSGQDEFEFRPRLGRIGSKGGAKPSSIKAYLKSARKRPGKINGGSGRAVAFAGARRIMIKARVHRLSGGGGGAQRAHISYLERDDAGKDREPAQFYNDTEEALDGQAWLKEHTNERHHFRFIVSPEDGEKLQDLKPFVRELVSNMEIDLETKLDWIAVDHYNTEHPHTHIVMSGKRDDGKDLVIPRDYLSNGMRERASALLTRELGLQTEQEISAKLERDISARKVTRIDRILSGEMDRNGVIDLSNLKRHRPHYQARLHQLRGLGLAQHQSGSIWTVDKELRSTLVGLERSDAIAHRIDHAIQTAGLDRIGAHEQGAFDAHQSVQGRLLRIGYADELQDQRYAIVDGLDGRVHHFDLGTRFPSDLRPGQMIEVKPRSIGAIEMDREIERVAAEHDGVYSDENHRALDPNVRSTHLEAVNNRIEALERAGLLERFSDVDVLITDGFIDRVNDHFGKAAKRSPTIVRKLEGHAFEQQIDAQGETWLDRQLAGTAKEPLSEAGLGGDVRSAMAQRMTVHKDRGLVSDPSAKTLTRAQLRALQELSLKHAASKVEKQTGLSHRPLKPEQEIEGTFKQVYQSANAKFAIIERGHEFSLVPWKPSLERMRNRQIQLSMSPGGEITWARGRSLGLSR
jgi:type IV secretory pathway VirD2 relaxase